MGPIICAHCGEPIEWFTFITLATGSCWVHVFEGGKKRIHCRNDRTTATPAQEAVDA